MKPPLSKFEKAILNDRNEIHGVFRLVYPVLEPVPKWFLLTGFCENDQNEIFNIFGKKNSSLNLVLKFFEYRYSYLAFLWLGLFNFKKIRLINYLNSVGKLVFL